MNVDLNSLREKVRYWFIRLIAFLLPPGWMRDKRYFHLWEARGYHVTPNHYHEPVPNLGGLSDALWQRRSDLVGIELNVEEQLRLLDDLSAAYKKDYESFPREEISEPHRYYVNNKAFESVDGEMFYCLIRHFKPRKIFEIGGGHSTYLAAEAIGDSGQPCELTVFEPYPGKILKKGFPGLHRTVQVKAQDVPLSEFEGLRKNDFLFIDSSHVVRIGSDVQYLVLEVLPRLHPGVLVHFHDIFLPSEYPKDWVKEERRFWTEQYLLQAFLIFNGAFKVLWAGSYMHLRHPDKLEAAFSSYKRSEQWPGSFWIQRL